MPAAASAILHGMPSPRDLRRLDTGGETVIFAGSVQLFRFAGDDTAMRHIAAAGLRQLGFAHRRDQHPATVHPRRHPAHYLPHHTTVRDLTRRPFRSQYEAAGSGGRR